MSDRGQINMEHLALLRDRVAEVGPDHCNMGSWIGCGPLYEVGVGPVGMQMQVGPVGMPECGTTACLAGWATTLAYEAPLVAVQCADRSANSYFRLMVNSEEVAVGAVAADWLNLTDCQLQTLFYDRNWPDQFRKLLQDEGDGKAMVGLLDAMLDRTVELTAMGRWFDADGNEL